MLQIKSFTFNPFQENMYVLYNQQKQCIIIDPGMYTPKDEKTVWTFLDENNLQPIQIVNTHCHLDHVFGINALIEKYNNIPFVYHALEQQVMDWAHTAAVNYGVTLKPISNATSFINETQTITLGDDELQILFTPGHSPGSICMYSPTQHFAICGDVLFRESIGRSDLPGGDMATLLNSIHTQLFTLPNPTIIYSGHGASTTIEHEKANNPFA